jgi:hypothetical protein
MINLSPLTLSPPGLRLSRRKDDEEKREFLLIIVCHDLAAAAESIFTVKGPEVKTGSISPPSDRMCDCRSSESKERPVTLIDLYLMYTAQRRRGGGRRRTLGFG